MVVTTVFAYDAAAYTDMLVNGVVIPGLPLTNFMNGRTNGVATYRNSDSLVGLMVQSEAWWFADVQICQR